MKMPFKKYYCDEVNTFESVGEGSFGTVYKGSINSTTIAVKINNGENWESVREVNRMKCLHQPNVMELIGTVPPNHHDRCNCEGRGLDATTTWIIMEYMPLSNLLDFVSGYPGGVSRYGMAKMAYQVANGMLYLHKNVSKVHMDLAARNVLVKDEVNVKTGDFGLLCDYDYSEHYYQNDSGDACPIRWTPPENLPKNGEGGCYTRKGDIWSFGVLLFEIWSRGKFPFAGLSNDEVMDNVRDGETVLDCDDLKAKSWVIELMQECFAYDKTDRPNFRQIAETIDEECGYDLD